MANSKLTTISNAEVDFPWSKNHLPTQLFINNEFVESVNPKKLEVFNPKDGSLVSNQVALAGEQDVDRAVAAAEAAFPSWRKTLPTIRRDLLLRLADLIEEHASSFSELTRITLGAPIGGWGAVEVQYSCQALRYFAGWADKHSGELYNEEDGFLKIVRNEPLGVTAGIIPWNAPLGFVCNKAAPAIVTGNCIILKLSEKTPFAGMALGSLIKAAGFPPGVIQLLSGDGSSGALISSHMGIRKVSFTGSTATGRKIQEAAARSNLKRVTLELGGKSPAIVFNDANLANAVQWCVNGITINSGQVCQAASRVYVQEGVYEKFADMYKHALEERARTTGDPDVMTTVVGPLADKHQFERVMGFIERGKADGNVLTGGHRLGEKGFYVSPTVFTDVDKDAEIVRKEIFGPVSVLNSFKTEEEVVELANDTNYGLAAGIFTQDINRALRLTTELEAGGVGVNCVSAVFWELPFGGMKESGLGRENGIHAIRSFTEPKAVYINLSY